MLFVYITAPSQAKSTKLHQVLRKRVRKRKPTLFLETKRTYLPWFVKTITVFSVLDRPTVKHLCFGGNLILALLAVKVNSAKI